MGSNTVLVEREDGVATIVLNRPDRMNTMNQELISALPERLREVAFDPEVRCVVLTGAGERAFSAGGDIGDMQESGPIAAARKGADGLPLLEDTIDHLRRGQEASLLLHEMTKPTLAVVNGACAGAALSLALACDLRIAADHAVFTTAFAAIGFSGDYGGSYFMTKVVGTAKARELYLLPDRIDAAEALRIGLVNRVVARDRIRAESMAMAKRLAAGPPLAHRYMKRNLNLAARGVDPRTALDLEAEAMMRTGRSEGFRSGALAFLGKRKPEFKGR
ncbi:2-(1,2-epoxy-1,2-dihydrophenyl)acetyl-CoA isomerase [Myxococcaceae bacterium]|nr:2-(1,2-epoxy-1,2-dihydrophenyl)acetyl-CoA isomerase [Myxococcaceae bacterium]